MAYSLGWEGRGTPRANPRPMSAVEFLETAASFRCSGVEVALPMVSPSLDPAALDEFRSRADDLGMTLTVSGPAVEGEGDLASLTRILDGARRLRAATVRFVLSRILCGDRRPAGGHAGWRRLMTRFVATLRSLAPAARERGLRLAVENHQDATSDDLLELCREVDHPAMGITLDTGNPLAVGEAILPYAEKVADRVANVHLKDYRVHAVDDGIVLTRCALGDGVVPFPDLLRRFSGRGVALQLELAALTARRIRILDPGYWEGLGNPGVPADQPLARLRESAGSGEDRSTPWERGAETELPAWERSQVARSVGYLASVTTRRTA